VTDLVDRLHPRHHEEVARMVLTTPVFDWIRSGADTNAAAYRAARLTPRVLVDMSDVDVSRTVLGAPLALPVLAAPMGVLGAVHPSAEAGVARGMAAAGAGTVLAVNSTASVEDVAAATLDRPLWIQLYNWDDRDATVAMVERAAAAGVRAVVPVVNTPVGAAHVPASVGFRLPDGLRFAHFEVSPGLDPRHDAAYLRWLVEVSPVPVVAKGVMHPDDALRALDAGCAGVVVSNHGGRQLAHSRSTLEALPAVADAVGVDGEVYVDGGIRTGADVLVALAAGARAVLVGRLVAYALAVGGADGVRRAVETLRDELLETAALCGTTRP
jgi:4-hydroxymandelate oxidase